VVLLKQQETAVLLNNTGDYIQHTTYTMAVLLKQEETAMVHTEPSIRNWTVFKKQVLVSWMVSATLTIQCYYLLHKNPHNQMYSITPKYILCDTRFTPSKSTVLPWFWGRYKMDGMTRKVIQETPFLTLKHYDVLILHNTNQVIHGGIF
jgi:hypothetical protein